MEDKIKLKDEFDLEISNLAKDSLSDHVTVYLKEISKIPLLSEDEEKKIVKRVLNGDEEARMILIKSNLRLVVKLAKNYLTYGLSIADLIEEGNIGLMIASRKYNLNHESKFSSYAAYWIKECMGRAIANKGRNIRIPVNLYEKVVSFRKAYRKLERDLGRSPSMEEIASLLNLSLEEVRSISYLQSDTLSINELMGENNDQEREAFLASDINSPEEIVEAQALEVDIDGLLEKCLSKREREIIILRFGLYGTKRRTLEDISLMYNLTRERVRQIEKGALNKLKNSLDIKKFAIYMDNPDTSLEYIENYQEEYLKAKEERKLSKFNKRIRR